MRPILLMSRATNSDHKNARPSVVLTRQLMLDEGVEVVNLIDPKSPLLSLQA